MTTVQREFFEALYSTDFFEVPYNIFCCEQAILISESLQSEDNIINFNGVGWDEQVKLVNGLSNDHSGNTFQMSCRMAIQYLPILKSGKRNDKINDILKL